MAEFKFVSPSVKFAETDITTVSTEQLGVTSVGLVGESLKGTAFEPIPIRDTTDFQLLFGSQSAEKRGGIAQYPAPYAANRFLSESNNLTFTRVLGLSGMKMGSAWLLKMRGAPVKGALVNSGSDSLTGITYNSTIDYNFTYLTGETSAYYNIGVQTETPVQTFLTGLNIGGSVVLDDITFKNQTGEYFTVDLTYTLDAKNGATVTGTTYDVTVKYDVYETTISDEYNDTILGTIRSKATYVSEDLIFNVDNVELDKAFTGETFTINNINDSYDNTVTTQDESFTFQITETYLNDNSESIVESTSFKTYKNVTMVNGAGLSVVNSGALVVDNFIVSDVQVNKNTGEISYITLDNTDTDFSNITINSNESVGNFSILNFSSSSITINNPFDGTTYDITISGINMTTTTATSSNPTGATNYTEYNYFNSNQINDGSNNNLGIKFGFQNLVATGSTQSVPNDNVTSFYGNFTITSDNVFTSGSTDYVVSLNPNDRNFITKVLPKSNRIKNTDIWLENFFDDLVPKINNTNGFYGLSLDLIPIINDGSNNNTELYNNYEQPYKDADTPWVVSELRGNIVERLFTFKTIGDGNSANKEIKISFENIDPNTKEFDVSIRDFNDTDEKPIFLERYVRCTLDKDLSNYIGRRIGAVDPETGDFKFDQVSRLVYLFLDDDHPTDAYPSGFEGYTVRNTELFAKSKFVIEYKKEYLSRDRVNRTYLGISEKAYDTDISDGNGVNQNLFNYFGLTNSEDTLTKLKGFHMDSRTSGNTYVDGDYVIGEFQSGAGEFDDVSIINPDNPYNNRLTRKFTFVPAGGWDGWDEHRPTRTISDIYNPNSSRAFDNSDWNAYLEAIRTFANPEENEINVFSTPNINWSDNSELVKEAVNMVEDRADCLYIIDSPDVKGSTLAGDVSELSRFINIDSNYSATFSPYIEIVDEVNDTKLYVPPSVEILRAFARNDNQRFEWLVPAGNDYGQLNATNVRKRLSEPERDTMYAANVNPIARFNNTGIVVFGQKTLQREESALDRINVRRLLITLKKSISTIARNLLFDPNDQIVRDEFRSKVTPILDNVKNERGLFDYKLEDDGATPEILDTNQANFVLKLKPTRLLEFIGISFIITPTGASFEDV